MKKKKNPNHMSGQYSPAAALNGRNGTFSCDENLSSLGFYVVSSTDTMQLIKSVV